MQDGSIGLAHAMALIVAPAVFAQDCIETVWTENVEGYVNGDDIVSRPLSRRGRRHRPLVLSASAQGRPVGNPTGWRAYFAATFSCAYSGRYR